MEPHWSFPAGGEGWNKEMVEEADGESKVLLYEEWISQGGVEGGGKWGKNRGRKQDCD